MWHSHSCCIKDKRQTEKAGLGSARFTTRSRVTNDISMFDVSLLEPLWRELLVFLLCASFFLPLPTVYLLNESLFLAAFWSKKVGVYICILLVFVILLFVICTIVLYTTCYIVHISVYVQWQLHRIPVHRSGPVRSGPQGVVDWWTGGLGPGSKWIPVCNPKN